VRERRGREVEGRGGVNKKEEGYREREWRGGEEEKGGGEVERKTYLTDKPHQHPGSDDRSMSYPTH